MKPIPVLVTEDGLHATRGFLPELLFPWEDEYFKPSPDDRIKELVKAAAMIVREIKRHKSLI